jgi:hypothetical protein
MGTTSWGPACGQLGVHVGGGGLGVLGRLDQVADLRQELR